jgi:hypothetical protein
MAGLGRYVRTITLGLAYIMGFAAIMEGGNVPQAQEAAVGREGQGGNGLDIGVIEGGSRILINHTVFGNFTKFVSSQAVRPVSERAQHPDFSPLIERIWDGIYIFVFQNDGSITLQLPDGSGFELVDDRGGATTIRPRGGADRERAEAAIKDLLAEVMKSAPRCLADNNCPATVPANRPADVAKIVEGNDHQPGAHDSNNSGSGEIAVGRSRVKIKLDAMLAEQTRLGDNEGICPKPQSFSDNCAFDRIGDAQLLALVHNPGARDRILRLINAPPKDDLGTLIRTRESSDVTAPTRKAPQRVRRSGQKARQRAPIDAGAPQMPVQNSIY